MPMEQINKKGNSMNQEITLTREFTDSLEDAIENHMAWDKENKVYTQPNPLRISTRPQASELTNGEDGIEINIGLADSVIGRVELSPAEALKLVTNLTLQLQRLI